VKNKAKTKPNIEFTTLAHQTGLNTAIIWIYRCAQAVKCYFISDTHFFNNPVQLTPKRAVKQHDCALIITATTSVP
jgi:hypothetical protein